MFVDLMPCNGQLLASVYISPVVSTKYTPRLFALYCLDPSKANNTERSNSVIKATPPTLKRSVHLTVTGLAQILTRNLFNLCILHEHECHDATHAPEKLGTIIISPSFAMLD